MSLQGKTNRQDKRLPYRCVRTSRASGLKIPPHIWWCRDKPLSRIIGMLSMLMHIDYSILASGLLINIRVTPSIHSGVNFLYMGPTASRPPLKDGLRLWFNSNCDTVLQESFVLLFLKRWIKWTIYSMRHNSLCIPMPAKSDLSGTKSAFAYYISIVVCSMCHLRHSWCIGGHLNFENLL